MKKVAGHSREEIIGKCLSLIDRPGTACAVTLNSLMLKYAWKHPEVLRAIRIADLITPDSVGIVYASFLLGGDKVRRYPGIEMAGELIKTGRSAYFLGAAPGVALKAAKELKKRYPAANIVGIQNGFFNKAEEKEILKDIRSKTPDLLFVGLDMGRQELWIDKNRFKTGAGLVIGVGGSFDVFSGNLKRAPEIFKITGTEWLWRLRLESWRLGRIMSLPVFALAVMARYIKRKGLLDQ
ncbi:MAG: WecB/TagA/CpsF family glycosyltransferase [Elusimicrobiota bacterium]|nr:WecB/TagA/CpsF family glycosyltransferase [Elusimicrobiota bacterium]